jgi:energy-coupling factor transporter ATP-binding protein EcfA2
MNNYPIQFREEVLKPFFNWIKSGESLFIIGAPSVGKTRLMDLLMGDDPDALREGITPDRQRVKKYYLGDEISAKTWFCRVDMNRLRTENDWGFSFFELLLNTVLLACNRCESTDEIEKIKMALAALDSEVIESKDALKAHRLFEMAVNMLCQSYGIKLCFLLDEFDETYQTMPRELFAHLRAIRDANKYCVSYALFMRNLPDKLRAPTENEGFYELISRNMLGLGPYSQQDTLYIISQLENRHEISLSQDQRGWLYTLSGGHPGFTQALFKSFKEHPQAIAQMPNTEWCAKQEAVQEEFRKIWIGLLDDERAGLLEFTHRNQNPMSATTGKLLLAKGLLKSTDSNVKVFSPLFEYWLSKQ